MLKSGKPLPERLKHDAIVEALLELRFQSTTLPEVFLGRMVDHEAWKGLKQRRLPAYEIPAQIRDLDPNLKFTPLIEVALADGKGALRVGPSVVSLHRAAPYVGWAKFKPELERLVSSLFAVTDSLKLERIGLRYLNALDKSLHHVGSIADLDLKLIVGGNEIRDGVNFNFSISANENTECTVRLATKDFVKGLPPNAFLLVDVDVYTIEGVSIPDQPSVINWIESAHRIEKAGFFSLFHEHTVNLLKEA
jgi:uncharacterized protein (TIGR04255 family)